MAHCVKVVLDDACAKSLQQEEALHSSGQTCVTLSCTAGDSSTANAAGNIDLREESSNTCSERETPRMIAKVSADYGECLSVVVGSEIHVLTVKHCKFRFDSLWRKMGISYHLVGISLPQLDFSFSYCRQGM